MRWCGRTCWHSWIILLTHPTVAAAIEAKQLRVHGWVYDMSGGVVETYNARAGRFVPVGSASFASATPGEWLLASSGFCPAGRAHFAWGGHFVAFQLFLLG
jgi:hypothetical protein